MKNTKRWTAAMLAVLLVSALAAVSGVLAEAKSGTAQADAVLSEAQRSAIAAVTSQLPDAQIDYALMERDDGQDVWHVFYRQDGELGVCKVLNGTFEVRKVERYDGIPEDALGADQAVEALIAQKGALTVVELDLDWSGSRQQLCYEGEAELDGRRYEFEMTVGGQIIEWERN